MGIPYLSRKGRITCAMYTISASAAYRVGPLPCVKEPPSNVTASKEHASSVCLGGDVLQRGGLRRIEREGWREEGEQRRRR